MNANKSVIGMIAKLIESGNLEAAKAVCNACSSSNKKANKAPVDATKREVTKAQAQALAERDISKLKSYKDKVTGKDTFKEVKLASLEKDCYTIAVTRLDDVKTTKFRQIVNEATIKDGSHQLVTI